MKKIIAVLLVLFLFPINCLAISTSSEAVILMDEDTGRVLYSKNMNRKKLIASTTKIMTT